MPAAPSVTTGVRYPRAPPARPGDACPSDPRKMCGTGRRRWAGRGDLPHFQLFPASSSSRRACHTRGCVRRRIRCMPEHRIRGSLLRRRVAGSALLDQIAVEVLKDGRLRPPTPAPGVPLSRNPHPVRCDGVTSGNQVLSSMAVTSHCVKEARRAVQVAGREMWKMKQTWRRTSGGFAPRPEMTAARKGEGAESSVPSSLP
ncbi:hypothetical protein DFH07DRAFT_374008 [Mycena maculata]|uniref:Uncharacterized protein n=1 Tax=Mycena maculata TaxID=230809 RepID=A0AAD7H8R8_9AGAR|nr:hypothetical protein DFH07DRAFT_374008 [Mycena maculata]